MRIRSHAAAGALATLLAGGPALAAEEVDRQAVLETNGWRAVQPLAFGPVADAAGITIGLNAMAGD